MLLSGIVVHEGNKHIAFRDKVRFIIHLRIITFSTVSYDAGTQDLSLSVTYNVKDIGINLEYVVKLENAVDFTTGAFSLTLLS